MEKSKRMAKKTCCFAKTFLKKTQELIEISQVNFKIMQMKNKLERKLVKIGHAVYKKQKDEGIESLKNCLDKEIFRNYCEEIDGIYEEIDDLEEELRELKKEGICVVEYEKELEKKACICDGEKESLKCCNDENKSKTHNFNGKEN